jgi:hypothetical protein
LANIGGITLPPIIRVFCQDHAGESRLRQQPNPSAISPTKPFATAIEGNLIRNRQVREANGKNRRTSNHRSRRRTRRSGYAALARPTNSLTHLLPDHGRWTNSHSLSCLAPANQAISGGNPACFKGSRLEALATPMSRPFAVISRRHSPPAGSG